MPIGEDSLRPDAPHEQPPERAEQDLRLALQAVPAPVLIYDVGDDLIVFANDELLNLFSLPSLMQAQATPLAGVLPDGQDAAPLWAFLRQAIRQDGRSAIDWTFEAGRPIHTHITAQPIRFQGRDCLVLTVLDTSVEREREQALLRAAEREKEANQLKSRFLMNMSHEIRTPMNAIVGFTQVALRKPQTKENVDVFKKIFLSAQNLLSILNDILDFSKIEADKLDLIEGEFSLEELIASAFTIASQRIAEKRVEMLLDLRADVPYYIVGDKTRVWQIIKNLLDNAAKYTDEGHIVLSVELDEEGASADRVSLRFTVQDTGCGMTPDQLERLFSPFAQFHGTKTEKNAGTGLGIPIIRQLLPLMGGTIGIESEQGKGTRASVTLPFGRSDKRTTLKQVADGQTLRDGGVLIADDDEFACDIMKNLLALLGIEPVIVNTGAEAIAKVKEHENNGTPFKVIILDYMLGTDNGIEIARRLKNITVNQSKLLMISAYTKQLLKEEIDDIGFTDVIEKPFVPSVFLQSISSSIDVGIDIGKRRYQQFPGARVLLLEDNLINQEVAKGVLEVFGVVPDVAENGREGIRMLEQKWQEGGRYDLVFMDIMMPVMDGHEATTLIRTSDVPYRNVPIVAMTASVIKEEVERCRAEGMNGHLGKPLVLDDVHQALGQHLGKYRVEAAIERQGELSAADRFEAAGIDVKSGVQRFGGKSERYLSTLRSFSEGLENDLGPMREAFAPEREAESARRIHTLKGVAGNLGLTQLYEALVAFEATQRAGRPDEALYARVWACAADVRDVVLAESAAEGDAAPLAAGEKGQLRALLGELLSALDRAEPAACEAVMRKLTGKRWAAAPRDQIERLDKLVRQYEFVEATDAASRILEGVS